MAINNNYAGYSDDYSANAEIKFLMYICIIFLYAFLTFVAINCFDLIRDDAVVTSLKGTISSLRMAAHQVVKSGTASGVAYEYIFHLNGMRIECSFTRWLPTKLKVGYSIKAVGIKNSNMLMVYALKNYTTGSTRSRGIFKGLAAMSMALTFNMAATMLMFFNRGRVTVDNGFGAISYNIVSIPIIVYLFIRIGMSRNIKTATIAKSKN